MMGRTTYSIVAVIAVLLAVIPAIYRSQWAPAEQLEAASKPPRVSGRNNTVLFLTTDANGLSNVHLAAIFSLLEQHPAVEIHYASWPEMTGRLEGISAAAAAKTGREEEEKKQISFYELPGPGVVGAAALAGQTPTNLPHAPGRRGWSSAEHTMTTFLALWSAQDHYDIYVRMVEIIEQVDPAVVVLDTMLAPAFDAIRATNRRHIILSPNQAAHVSFKQPWLSGFWKYPALSTGFAYPVPWYHIPENIFLNLRVLYASLKMAFTSEKRQFLLDRGVENPLDFLNQFQEDVPYICPMSNDVDIALPFEVLTPEVHAVGPIVISTTPAALQDPELAAWVSRAPTVMFNLGTIQRYTEESARAVAEAIDDVVNKTDVQVIWKMKKNPRRDFDDAFLEPLQGHIASGRVRVTNWIAVDPSALLETGDIALSVHHGGANLYFEAIAAGVPHVVLPMWLDCYGYGALAEDIGVGIWGNKKAAPFWTADELSKAMLKILDGGPASVSIKAKAKAIGEKVQNSVPGRDAAATIIARIAASGTGA